MRMRLRPGGPGFQYAYPVEGHHHDGHGVFLLLPLFVMLLFAAGFLVLLWRTRAPATAAGPVVDPALHELRTRYARGEVTREEFLQAETDLRGALPPS